MINKKVIDEIKQGNKSIITVALAPNIDAQVFLNPTKSGEIKLRSYLMSRSPSERIAQIREKVKTVKSLAELEYDCRAVCNSLLAAYHAANKPAATAHSSSSKSFSKRVLAVPRIFDPHNYAPYVKRGWGKRTTEAAVNYYAYTIGKVYEQYGDNATESDFQAFLTSEINRIYEERYKKPCSDEGIINQRRENIYNGIMDRWQQALAVQRFLLANHPEGNWPTTLIPVEARYRAPKAEEIKAISYEQYTKLCTILWLLCKAGVAEAYGAALEVTCAARVGESGAPLIGEFQLYDTYGRYYIDYQLDGKGGRTRDLKKENSRRYVVFGDFLMQIVNLRIKQLKAQGYTDDEIAVMPLASATHAPKMFLTGPRISTFLRELLVLVGCDEAWLEAEAERLRKMEKVHGTVEDLDVNAHLLRRTLTTFWANGGVPIGYVDAQLGHGSKVNKGIDFASIDTARRMAAMIERSHYHGSLCDTNNPAYTTVQVDSSMGYKLDGNTRYSFVPQKDMWLELDVNALEPGRGVYIETNHRIGVSNLMARQPVDTIESRRARPILPQLPKWEEVEKWIVEARDIDLSDIIKKSVKESQNDQDQHHEIDPQ